MEGARLKRIMREISACEKDPDDEITVKMVDESPFHLIGTFPGPENSPFEKGLFKVDIVVPEGYPFHPLQMRFLTRVYHPNVSSQSGAICLDILKDQWSPVYTLKTTLMSLRSLLCSPEPNDPQDAEVAKHYTSNLDSYNKTAEYWTKVYAAREPQNDNADVVQLAGLEEADVQKFCQKGYNRNAVVTVLKRLNYRGDNAHNITDEQVISLLGQM
ncbi:Ubiquitin-conjugating enzyme E2 1 [Malassezia pachydermatis]|uniref:Ubiquitin-conjugating enzyme E2 1 n=1 Tax=Malassezia pachydermatis TaxID=77020 RepID=A0A0M9VP62_9BASI|nr:ubc1-e2 ubiquitin-conjugating enzyme [Malassezia pachydermatis]KOS14083.1 ubc1-e2 ubiquitin-conjugating enzyme [Malassezia pachydermatis]